MSKISGPSLIRLAVIGVWIVLMSLLAYRHYGPGAKKAGLTSVIPADLDKKTALPFNLRLPESTAYLKVRISGIDPSGFDISGGRQLLSGSVLTIYRETPENPAQKATELRGEDFLGESFTIRSKDPDTAALAKQIAGGETDQVAVAHKIHDWVYRSISKIRTFSVPVSTDVLKTRKGDCNEHAVLFTALARAAGIPSRTVLGLVYDDGALHYHSWAEILINNKWIAVDPVLGEFPADASHIRLIAGDLDKMSEIISVMGKIRIEGMEYR